MSGLSLLCLLFAIWAVAEGALRGNGKAPDAEYMFHSDIMESAGEQTNELPDKWIFSRERYLRRQELRKREEQRKRDLFLEEQLEEAEADSGFERPVFSHNKYEHHFARLKNQRLNNLYTVPSEHHYPDGTLKPKRKPFFRRMGGYLSKGLGRVLSWAMGYSDFFYDVPALPRSLRHKSVYEIQHLKKKMPNSHGAILEYMTFLKAYYADEEAGYYFNPEEYEASLGEQQ